MIDHLIRVGPLGHLGRFHSTDGMAFQRGMSVICRTSRGLEFGSVLNCLRAEPSDLHAPSTVPAEGSALAEGTASATPPSSPLAGQILRGATPEDHLLWSRLQKDRIEALDRCQLMLDERQLMATLMDCEVLFDGKSIFFYFLGEPNTDVEAMTSELAETYEATARLQQFAENMTLGCGPDCGTKDGGCSDGGCSTCAIASACKVTSRNDDVAE